MREINDEKYLWIYPKNWRTLAILGLCLVITWALRKNLTFLNTVIQNGDWNRLRRHPPCIVPDPRGEEHLMELALQRVRDWSTKQTASQRSLAEAS